MPLTLGTHSYVVGLDNPFDIDVRVRNYSSVAQTLVIRGGQHPTVPHPEAVSTFPFAELLKIDYWPCVTSGRVNIGSDVWIGGNVTIRDGVDIGDGAIIGTAAVVAKSVPAFAVAVGNPARVVKYRYSLEVVEQLLAIQWWDWPEEQIRDNIRAFKDIDVFLKLFATKQSRTI